MIKRYLLITLFVALTLIVIGGMQFKSLITYYKKSSTEQLQKQAQIIGLNIEKEHHEFIEDIQYRASTTQFELLLTSNSENRIAMDTIKRFYAKYQYLIDSLEIFDSLTNLVITKDENNYFSFSPIKNNDSSRSLKQQPIIEQEGMKTFYYIPVFNQAGEIIANLRISLNIPQFIKNLVENYYLGEQSWIWCLNEQGQIIISLYSEGQIYKNKIFKATKINEILVNLHQQFEGVLEHNIDMGTGETKTLSIYYPIKIFEQKIEIILSLNEKVLFGIIKEKITAMTLCFVLLIIWMAFLFKFVIQKQELAEAEKKKAQELFAINKELKDLQNQLIQSEKMASIGQLAAGVAHEINNPIGFVTSNVEALDGYVESFMKFFRIIDNLKKSIESEDIKKSKFLIEEVRILEKEDNFDFIIKDISNLVDQSKIGLERVKKIVMDLRTFARESSEEKMELVSVNDVIESALSIVNNEIKYKCEIEKDFGELPAIKCHPQKICQVVINLVMNASQAIQDKGKIRIKTYLKDKYECIDIEDTGSGIPQEKINKIFDPFFTTKDVGKGTGLGLSISYEIVKLHGGDILVESQVGRGTKMTIVLPLIQKGNT